VNFLRREIKMRTVCVIAAFVLATAVSGCAGRKPVAANAPPPITPAATSPVTAEKARPGDSAPRATTEQPTESGYTEEGSASWYGEPFHGRRASNGEIYDMNKMTAAHRTMAFGTMVRVTNLTNGKTAVVRITDRGPFVDNRIIDLSRAAAQAIESIGSGVVLRAGNLRERSLRRTYRARAHSGKKTMRERLRARLNATPSAVHDPASRAGRRDFYRAGKAIR
jgi:rare lipoprotein A (peptidoglycan hydrolase)